MYAAIETSFDETALAVCATDGRTLHALLSSQVELHQAYDGVVPELAARTHLSNLPQMWRELPADLADGVTHFGVTAGPGLPGCLLAGVNFARGVAAAKGVPLFGLNHLAGHLFSPFMPEGRAGAPAGEGENYSAQFSSSTQIEALDKAAGTSDSGALTGEAPALPAIPFPHLGLLVSGGHTELFLVHSLTRIELLGQTRDDAVGELLDKVSAMLGYGYPGGAKLEQLARSHHAMNDEGRSDRQFDLPVPMRDSHDLDFSFSGLKTAVRRRVGGPRVGTTDALLRREFAWGEGQLTFPDAQHPALLANLFDCVLDSLWRKVETALQMYGVNVLTVSGGVAINGFLRDRFAAECARAGVQVRFPARKHCLDNAEMMAFLLKLTVEAGIEAEPFDARSNWLP